MSGEARKLLVLCPYPEGVAAGQRLKYEQYFDDWRTHGYQITVSPFMDGRMWQIVHQPGHVLRKIAGTLRGALRRWRDLFHIKEYDLVYVFMWVTPIGSTLAERLVRHLAKRVVYDIEDNVILREGQPGMSSGFKRLFRGSAKPYYLVGVADHVISSSPALNDWCLQHNRKRRSTYVSSSVDTDRFVPVNPYSNDRVVTIGWTGTFSSRPFLDMLRDVFCELSRSHRFKLRVIGNFDYDFPGVDLEVLQWSASDEVSQMQGIDIGIYPLPVDDWVSGKSGLKAIQYGAFGLPTVATNVGATPLIIKDMVTGMLVTSPAEWLQALRRLLDDPELRRRLGQAARQNVVAHHSLHAIKTQYRSILEEVVKG
ncbi:MAG TPA: glycosyltransferase [Rhodanobacteraceae bacterium]|nr:glycosyltransferase [Rhodanobacteraceae bacterium]